MFAAAFSRLSVRASAVGRSRYGRMADKPRACDVRARDRFGTAHGLCTGGVRLRFAPRTDECRVAAAFASCSPFAPSAFADAPRALYGRATDRQRTSDRRQTGGHSSDADILRHSEMGGGAADLPRTGNGHATGYTRTIPPTGGQRACLRAFNGRNTDLLRRHFARRVEDNAPYPWALVIATVAARIVIPAAGMATSARGMSV